jgi:hypothetical protein
MATTSTPVHDAGATVQLRHIPLSRIVVLSRGSAASVRIVARSVRSWEAGDGVEAAVLSPELG